MSLAPLPRRLALGLLLLAPAAAIAQDTRYGHYRVVEGTAQVIRDGEASEEAQENMPLVTGERLWTDASARVEVVLPDGTLVRVAGNTEVTFDELARSADGTAGGTLLYLDRGEVQVVTEETAGVAAYPRVDTPDATVYLEGAGTYRIEAARGATGVVVRRGDAELVTRRGSSRLADGQEAWADDRGGRPAVEVAGGYSQLERWGSLLHDEYRRAAVDPDVDRSLGYSASRMNGHGSWVQVESRRAWRPRVANDWSPYRHGRWVYTRSGLTWVSYESWGWVPYHYGSWDYAPGWGWVWYPGRAYAPAWVYWYWGPTHVGWCPIGYYSRLYGHRYYGDRWHDRWYGGFRFGVHGWAGGHIDDWKRWNFVDCRYVNDRRLYDHTRWAHQLGVHDLPRGVIATDTRDLEPAIATRPSYGMRQLAGHPTRADGRPLPDLSDFVAGKPDLPADDVRVALPIDDRGAGGWDDAKPEPIDARGGRPRGGQDDGVKPGDDLGTGGPGLRTPQPRYSSPPTGDDKPGDAGGPVTRTPPPRSGRPADGDDKPGDDVGGGPATRTPPPRYSSPPGDDKPGDDGGAATRTPPRRYTPPPAADDKPGDDGTGGPATRTPPPRYSAPSAGDEDKPGDGSASGPMTRTPPPRHRSPASDDKPEDGGGPATRTPPPRYSSPSSDGTPDDGGSRHRPPPASDDHGEDKPEPPNGSAGARTPGADWRSADGVAQRTAPRTYRPPQDDPAAGRATQPTRDAWRQAPPRGDGSPTSSRSVPPVRRVVDSVRDARQPQGGNDGASWRGPAGDDKPDSAPPSRATSRGGYAPAPPGGGYRPAPPAGGYDPAPRGAYAPPTRSPGSRPSYAPPSPATRQPAVSQPTRSPDPGRGGAAPSGGRRGGGADGGSSDDGGGRAGRSRPSDDGGGGQPDKGDGG